MASQSFSPRGDLLDDTDYFMALALLTAQRSTVTNGKGAGACVVNKENKVIGVGSSGNDWHAELEAIVSSGDVRGCTMYVTDFPCNECTKLIVQGGITSVVYLFEDETANRHKVRASKRMLAKAKVCCEKFNRENDDNIVVTFNNEYLQHQGIERKPQDDNFMAMALLTARRSKDPSTQVGACLVNKENKIIGLGYNKMPDNHEDKFTWYRVPDEEPNKDVDNKHLYVCHAELNALINQNPADVRGSTIYVTLFPCQDCAKLIILSGVSTVIYLSDKYHKRPEFQASRAMLENAGVHLQSFYMPDEPQRGDVIITFTI